MYILCYIRVAITLYCNAQISKNGKIKCSSSARQLFVWYRVQLSGEINTHKESAAGCYSCICLGGS